MLLVRDVSYSVLCARTYAVHVANPPQWRMRDASGQRYLDDTRVRPEKKREIRMHASSREVLAMVGSVLE